MKRSLIITISSITVVSALIGTGLAYWGFTKEVTKDALSISSFNLDEHLGTGMSSTKKARLVFNQDEILLTDGDTAFTGSETSYTPISDYSIQYKGADAATQMFNEGYFYISKELYPYLWVLENGKDLFIQQDTPEGLESNNLPTDCYYLPLTALPNRYDSATNTRTIYDYDLSFKYTKAPENSDDYEELQSVINQSTMGFAFKRTEGEYYVVNFHDYQGNIIKTERIEKGINGSIRYSGSVPKDDYGYQEITGTTPDYQYIDGKNYVFKEFSFHVFNGWTKQGDSNILLKPGDTLSTDTLAVNDVPLDLYPYFVEQTNRVGYLDNGTDMSEQKVIFTAVDDRLGDSATHDPLYLTLNDDGTASIIKATSAWVQDYPDGKVELRDSYMGIPLTGIEDGAFEGLTDIKELTIPGSVVTIGSTDPSAPGAFESCTNMTTVTINAGDIESIGCNTFKNCTSLTNINLPDGLTEIHDNAFNFVDKVREFRLPNTLTYIGKQAFLHMNALEQVVIPATVEYIGDEAFAKCVNLTSFTFDSPCTSENGMTICNQVFRGSMNIPEIIFPEGLVSIGDKCFMNCYDNPKVVSFPSTMQHFGDQLFCNFGNNIELDFSRMTNLTQSGFDIGENWFNSGYGYIGQWATHTVKLPCKEEERFSLPAEMIDMFRNFYNGVYVFTDKTTTVTSTTYQSYWNA